MPPPWRTFAYLCARPLRSHGYRLPPTASHFWFRAKARRGTLRNLLNLDASETPGPCHLQTDSLACAFFHLPQPFVPGASPSEFSSLPPWRTFAYFCVRLLLLSGVALASREIFASPDEI